VNDGGSGASDIAILSIPHEIPVPFICAAKLKVALEGEGAMAWVVFHPLGSFRSCPEG
jgi:hypothetical protein